MLAVNATVPERFAPGSSNVTVGAVESTCTTVVPVVRTLPASSVISSRRS
jgi:hypothetical protein